MGKRVKLEECDYEHGYNPLKLQNQIKGAFRVGKKRSNFDVKFTVSIAKLSKIDDFKMEVCNISKKMVSLVKKKGMGKVRQLVSGLHAKDIKFVKQNKKGCVLIEKPVLNIDYN